MPRYHEIGQIALLEKLDDAATRLWYAADILFLDLSTISGELRD
ncbi:hypothetical protein AB0O52_04905 [Arthrobacter sp. NPDC080073]